MPEVVANAGIPPWAYFAGLGIAALTFVILSGKGLYAWGKWVQKANTDGDNFKSFMKEVREDIKNILVRLPPATVGSSSPIQLTDLGKKVADRLDAAEWAARTAPELAQKAKDAEDHEVQDLCFEYVANSYEPDRRQEDTIKKCIYDFGLRDRQAVLDVLAVVLRDVLLSR